MRVDGSGRRAATPQFPGVRRSLQATRRA